MKRYRFGPISLGMLAASAAMFVLAALSFAFDFGELSLNFSRTVFLVAGMAGGGLWLSQSVDIDFDEQTISLRNVFSTEKISFQDLDFIVIPDKPNAMRNQVLGKLTHRPVRFPLWHQGTFVSSRRLEKMASRLEASGIKVVRVQYPFASMADRIDFRRQAQELQAPDCPASRVHRHE